MKDSKRNSRIRLLVKRLNRQRKKQATQIDLLCNDIIAAHKDFLDTVRTLSFATEFYESLTGINDLDSLFYTSAHMIKRQIPDANLVFFLTQPECFQLYAFDYGTTDTNEPRRLEQYFTNQLVTALTKVDKPCGLDELLQMGLQVSPVVLKDISATTVPIAGAGSAAGFILVYKYSGDIDPRQVKLLWAVRRGLTKAIRTYTCSGKTSS